MKEGLRGKHYTNDEEVENTVIKKWLKEQSKEFYEARIHALIQRWNIAIEKWWLRREVGMSSTDDQFHFDVWYMFLCWELFLC